MAKYLGTVRRTDLEGGGWTLVSDQGVVYQLKGLPSRACKEGVRVEIVGQIASDQVGITMVGDLLEVKSYRIID